MRPLALGAAIAGLVLCAGTSAVVGQAASPSVPQTVPRRCSPDPGDFDFQGADIRIVLRSFVEICKGLNLVIDPAVKGTVDIKLTQVPGDQALDVILKSSKLRAIVDGNVVRIVRLEDLTSEEAERQKLASAQAPGNLTVRTFTLNYAQAKDLEPLLTTMRSEIGSVRFDQRTNTLIVRDIPERLDAAAALLSSLDRAEPQVEIEARVVQTNRDSARELGIKWGLNGRAAPELGNTTSLVFPNTGSVRAGVDLLPSAAPSAVGVAMGAINGALNLDVELSALERTGKGRILSSPRVTTQNNKQAEMTQGVQIPIQTVSYDSVTGNSYVTVTFKDAALKLIVTPQITAANTVIMQIELENATPDYSRSVNNIPPIDTQRARTSVQVTDGATTVIGGIFVSREQSAQDRTPGLHRLPLLGWLFKRDNTREESTELLIFITPRILRSAS